MITKQSKRTQMSSRTLPDELVEKILLMLPFATIAKARGLSKLWRARLSAVSSLDDEVTRQDAVAFQKRVQDMATNSKTFFPMCVDNDLLRGYDGASRGWVSFPSLSFLPKAFWSANTDYWIEGSLLYGISWEKDTLYVANLLTRSWKRSVGLPPLGILGSEPVSVWDASAETYKVIYLHRDRSTRLTREWFVQIYEPRSDEWSSIRFNKGEPLPHRPVYLNGVLYVAAYRQGCLLAINIAERTLEELQLSFDGVFWGPGIDYLMICNGKLHMVVGNTVGVEPLRVLEVDLEARRLLEVATAPVALSKGGPVGIQRWAEPVNDGNCIYFSAVDLHPITRRPLRNRPGRKVAFDVRTHEWAVLDFGTELRQGLKWNHEGHDNFIKWIPCSFQHGLNPFAEV